MANTQPGVWINVRGREAAGCVDPADYEKVRGDVIDAALAMPNADDLTLLVNRATALSTFLATDDGENLIQGFKRAHNILRQAEDKDGVEYSFGPDPKLAETGQEQALFAALDTAEATIAPEIEMQ